MKRETRDIILEGLHDGLKSRIAKIFDVLSTAGESDRLQRFKTGLDNAVKAYEHACEFVDKECE